MYPPGRLHTYSEHSKYRAFGVDEADPADHDTEDKRAAKQQQKLEWKTSKKRRASTIAWLTFVLILASSSRMQAQDSLAIPASAIPTIQATDSGINTFQWKSAVVDASIFLGLEHGFRLAEDPLVRAGLRGPFFEDYFDSIKDIHGWGDGDPFVVNYIGHPTQGAVTGFIEIHNDPRYRNLEVGKSSRYWESRLRAMAFSAAYSMQFEIGPISEATIGNSQFGRNDGIVDWVITPTLGTAWLVGEDLTDKYLIRKIERHTRSVPLMAVARTFLNPCRGVSNIMGRRAPWHRDDRPGIRMVANEPR
jgi:hypothetical protein